MTREPAYGICLSAAALFVSFIASMSNSIDFTRSLQPTALVAVMYGVAFAVSVIVRRVKRHWLLWALWLWLPGMAALHVQLTAPGQRLWSPTALGNVACIVLLTAIPMRHWLTVGLAVAVILLTGSRVAWLNAAAGIVTLAVAEPRTLKPLLKAKWLGVLIVPVLLWQATRGYERADIWWTAIMLIRDAPLTGWGPGAFGLFNKYPDAHNIVLHLLAETGPLSLMAGGMFAWAVGSRVRELIRATHDPLYMGVAASLVGTLAAGLIGVPTYEIPVNLALAVLIGMVL
jgi:O-antigen ligase